MPIINVKKLDENAVLPTYGSEFSAGADLYALCDEEIVFAPNETKFVRTGLAMEIPEGYAGLIYARSGLACKRGLAPANKVGVVDSDYRGEVMAVLAVRAGSKRERNERLCRCECERREILTREWTLAGICCWRTARTGF